MQAANIGPVGPGERTQSAFDLFLIFAGANIVATTLQVGASLAPSYTLHTALVLIAAGSVAGSLLVASLVPLGPRLGVPSVIAARAALGTRGAGLVALVLYLTNFAWIAVNNVIAASACSAVAGGPASSRWWAVGLGLLATVIVAGGPAVVGRADRVAVPLLLATGIGMTVACLRIPSWVLARPVMSPATWIRGLDIVIAYQVSWILMFADYSRYTRSPARAPWAVFLALTLTSLWFMPLGLLSSRAAGSADPGAMLEAVGLGAGGAVLLALATVTTNFVNIYLSSLALKSLLPRIDEQGAVWSTGLCGAGLSLLSAAWLDKFASYMLVLGATLVPIGGVLLAHFFMLRRPVDVPGLYARVARGRAFAGLSVAGMAAWLAGAAAYFAGSPVGATLPALVASVTVYLMVAAFRGKRETASYRPRPI